MPTLPSPAAVAVRRLIDRFVPRGALILSALSLGYFAAGIVRNRVLAAEFGTGAQLDAYNAAFRIPEIALDILVGAGLSAPFVPIFSRLLLGTRADGTDAEPGRAEAFGQSVLTAAIGAIVVALVVLFLAAPWLGDTVWSSFDRPTRAVYVELVRINCLGQVMFALSMGVGEVLVARRRFLAYGIAPILYQAGIVAGAIALGPSLGIAGAGWGAVAGAGLHLSARALGARRAGFHLRPRAAWRTPEFREFLRLMAPRMLSYPIDPVTVTFLTALAAGVGVGTASALSFVLDYQFVPVQVIAIAFSLAAFPTLAAAWSAGDGTTFRRVAVRTTVVIGALTALAAITLAIFGRTLVSVLLRGGAFDEGSVTLTAGLLLAFAITIPIDSLSYPLSRALYATHNTIWQVAASVLGLAVLVGSAQVLVPALGAAGIAAAYALGGAMKLVGLGTGLVVRARAIDRTAAATATEPVSPAGSSG
ncbi:MAG TPA: lipid II flippase MurJ [Candidatus Limnocylindrales bacterium]|nr:lipid II flippase MurJ [Candidatus Limnocylindrales bacterium]